MTAGSAKDRWSRIQEVFHATLERPESERWDFLTDACVDDADLRAEVASLIAAHEDEGPVGDFSERGVEGPAPAERIGLYRLIRRIGEGGMGSVFLAERQGPDYTQTVALKLIQGAAVNPMLEDRLRIERRILARLEHPGIARLVDGGTTESGQAYYAMEYVQGTSLLRYCDEQRLTVADRLRLFIEICGAVHHAHSQLVVHRDLKPGNIFVTSEGRPKLLDFGIAKLLDDAQSGVSAAPTAPWFTPAYASPEQVTGGSVGTASDQYALGVVLFELLTGRLPYEFASASPVHIAQVICEHQPARPSARVVEVPTVVADHDGVAALRRSSPERLRRSLSGDLDTIVLKALTKEPTRRYHSVEQFADDLRRHLDGKPVLARPDSVGYRVSKFVGRHRITVLAAAVVVASLVGGIVAATWQATVASRERNRAEVALRRSEGVAEFVIDLFSTEDASMDVSHARALLERGRRQAEELSAQPEVQAQTFDALARAFYNLAQYQEAADLYTRAYEIRQHLFPNGHVDVARSLTRMSDAVGRLGLGDSTQRLLVAAWQMEQRLGPTADRAELETLTELGRVARGYGRLEESDTILRQALAVGNGRVDPDDPLRMEILHQLAMTALGRRELVEAERLFREIITTRRRRLGPDDPQVAAAMVFLGDVMTQVGHPDQAEALYREGLRIAEQSLGPESVRLLHGINSLASLLAGAGKGDEAIALMRRGVRIAEQAYGTDNIAAARQKESFAGVLHRAGRHDEAESLYLEVLDHKRALLGDWTLPSTLFSLTNIAAERRDFDEAEQYAAEGLAIQRERGMEGPTLAHSLRKLAAIRVARGAYEAAEDALLEAVALSAPAASPEKELEANYLALSRLYDEWGKQDQAASYRALALQGSSRPSSNPR